VSNVVDLRQIEEGIGIGIRGAAAVPITFYRLPLTD
jgi:hypothetical protein